MEKLGVIAISSVLDRRLTETQVAVLRSIHWFAESQVQKTPDHELVSLITALESVFSLGHNSVPKTDRICEATAVLVESDEPSRIDVFRRLKDACFYRGEVVHQGADASDYCEMHVLRAIVQAVVSAIIHRMEEFKTPKEVVDWVEKQGADVVKKATGRNRP